MPIVRVLNLPSRHNTRVGEEQTTVTIADMVVTRPDSHIVAFCAQEGTILGIDLVQECHEIGHTDLTFFGIETLDQLDRDLVGVNEKARCDNNEEAEDFHARMTGEYVGCGQTDNRWVRTMISRVQDYSLLYTRAMRIYLPERAGGKYDSEFEWEIHFGTVLLYVVHLQAVCQLWRRLQTITYELSHKPDSLQKTN